MRASFMTAPVAVFLLGLFLLGLAIGDTEQARAMDIESLQIESLNPLDLSYMPSDSFAAWITHPQRIRKLPLFAAMPEEGMRNSPMQMFLMGFPFPDDVKLEQGAFLLSPATAEVKGPDEFPFVPVLIFRFTAPVEAERLMEGMHLGGTAQEKTHRGKTYYLFGRNDAAVYLPDDRTLILSIEKKLQKIIAAKKNTPGPLIDRLRRVDASNHFIAAAVLDPAREEIVKLAGQLKGELPAGLAELTKAPEYVKAATLTGSFTGPTLVTLVLEAKDTASSGELDQLVRKGRDALKKLYDKERQAILKNTPAPLGKAMEKLTDELFSGFSVSEKSSRVVLSFPRPESLEEFVKAIAVQNAERINPPRAELEAFRKPALKKPDDRTPDGKKPAKTGEKTEKKTEKTAPRDPR